MTDLTGQTVVVTGAASGLGRAFARLFRASGADVVGGDLNEEGLAGLSGDGIVGVRTDVSLQADVDVLVAVALDRTGRVDVLINNAGVSGHGRIEDLASGAFEQVMAVHAFATLYGIKAALPAMKAQDHGRIINVLSRGAEIPNPDGVAYSAGKAAAFAITRSAARQTEGFDILVNGLIPGPTNTAIWGVDRPDLQAPEAAFPTAKMLATLPPGGPSGRVFWDMEEYQLFHPDRNGGRGAVSDPRPATTGDRP